MNLYVVEIKDQKDNVRQKTFKTLRDALCCATDYHKVKKSKVLKDKVILNEFSF